MTMHGIQITHLRAFLMVVRTGSYTRAGEALGYSEPAVHLQVRALRRLLGDPLFERERGGVRLTRFGQSMLPLVERAVESIDSLVEAAEQNRAAQARTLAVGVGRSSGSYVMPALAGLFRQRHPDIDLQVQMIPVDQIVDRLIDGEIDIGFSGGLDTQLASRPPANGHRVITVPWSRYGWTLAAAPTFLAGRDWHAVPEVPVYLPAFAEPFRAHLVQQFACKSLVARIFTVENAEAAKTVAHAALGVAAIPVYAARLELSTGELVPCLQQIDLPPTCIRIAHRHPSEHPLIMPFVRFLHDVRREPATRQLLFPAVTRP